MSQLAVWSVLVEDHWEVTPIAPNNLGNGTV